MFRLFPLGLIFLTVLFWAGSGQASESTGLGRDEQEIDRVLEQLEDVESEKELEQILSQLPAEIREQVEQEIRSEEVSTSITTSASYYQSAMIRDTRLGVSYPLGLIFDTKLGPFQLGGAYDFEEEDAKMRLGIPVELDDWLVVSAIGGLSVDLDAEYLSVNGDGEVQDVRDDTFVIGGVGGQIDVRPGEWLTFYGGYYSTIWTSNTIAEDVAAGRTTLSEPSTSHWFTGTSIVIERNLNLEISKNFSENDSTWRSSLFLRF